MSNIDNNNPADTDKNPEDLDLDMDLELDDLDLELDDLDIDLDIDDLDMDIDDIDDLVAMDDDLLDDDLLDDNAEIIDVVDDIATMDEVNADPIADEGEEIAVSPSSAHPPSTAKSQSFFSRHFNLIVIGIAVVGGGAFLIDAVILAPRTDAISEFQQESIMPSNMASSDLYSGMNEQLPIGADDKSAPSDGLLAMPSDGIVPADTGLAIMGSGLPSFDEARGDDGGFSLPYDDAVAEIDKAPIAPQANMEPIDAINQEIAAASIEIDDMPSEPKIAVLTPEPVFEPAPKPAPIKIKKLIPTETQDTAAQQAVQLAQSEINALTQTTENLNAQHDADENRIKLLEEKLAALEKQNTALEVRNAEVLQDSLTAKSALEQQKQITAKAQKDAALTTKNAAASIAEAEEKAAKDKAKALKMAKQEAMELADKKNALEAATKALAAKEAIAKEIVTKAEITKEPSVIPKAKPMVIASTPPAPASTPKITKVITPTKAAKPAVVIASNKTPAQLWSFKAAQPDQATLKNKISGAFKTVKVGDTVDGFGFIQSIAPQNGVWTVQGSKGSLRP